MRALSATFAMLKCDLVKIFVLIPLLVSLKVRDIMDIKSLSGEKEYSMITVCLISEMCIYSFG